MRWWKSLLLLLNKISFRKEEVLYVSFYKGELFSLLKPITQSVKNDGRDELDPLPEIKHRLVGVVKENFFCVSKKVSHPQSFLPRVTGRFYNSGKVDRIELTYQLFPLTRVLMIVFLIVCIAVGAYSFLVYHRFFSIVLTLFCMIITYLIAKANFLIHCRDIRKVIKEELCL